MRSMSAKDAKNSFGLLLDSALAEPIQVMKHGRPVVVVMSVEEFRRLNVPITGKGEGALGPLAPQRS
jgi:prevent-host-death family protein